MIFSDSPEFSQTIEIPQEFRTKSYLEFSRIWFLKAHSIAQQEHIRNFYSDTNFVPQSLYVSRDDLLMSHAYSSREDYQDSNWPSSQMMLGEFQP